MTVPLDSDLLRVFLAINDTGSLTRAADIVGRTQSAVSMQVKRLEESVGQALFDRQPRGVVLTVRGAQLLPYARRVVDLLDEATTALRVKPLDGPVRIGIPEEYSETILPKALAAFAERHPAVEVTVRCDHSSAQLAALEADALDIAVVFDWNRVTQGEVLCIDPTVWVTSVVHRQEEKHPLPVAVYLGSSWCTEFALRSLDQHGLVWRAAFECKMTSGLRIAARTGLALAALSRSTIPDGCRELTAADGFPMVDSSRVVLRRNSRGSSPAIDGLAEMIREAFRPMAWITGQLV